MATNGLITGNPTAAGTSSATLTASNSIGPTNQTATFTIAKGTPVISNWPTAAPITFGQALSNSVLSGGVANPTGNFIWTVPTNLPNAGTNSQSVTFTPSATNDYNAVTNTVSLVVNKVTPVLTWAPSPATSLTYPAALSSTQLNATSSVAGTFSYNPTNGSVLNAGTNTLVATFTPTVTTNYTSGGTITNTVVVAKGSQNIIFGSLPIKYVGDAAFNLTATASSGLTVTYTSSNTNVATVLGSLVTIIGEGNTTITANQAGDSNWNPAMSVPQILRVDPAINRGLVAYYPFNGNANDESGNGNHGVISGAVLSSDRNNTSSSAYLFSGSQYIRIPNSSSLSLGYSDFTVSTWIKTTSSGSAIIYSDDSDDFRPGFELSHIGSGAVYEFSPTTNGNTLGLGKVPMNDGKWHQLILTCDRDGRSKIYVDGMLDVDQASDLTLASISNSVDSRIGMNPTGGGGFVGLIDEVRIYNRALSAAEVGQLYQSEVGTIDSDGDGLTDAFEAG
jgi:hypothetical protein